VKTGKGTKAGRFPVIVSFPFGPFPLLRKGNREKFISQNGIEGMKNLIKTNGK
jgi:hypothetical protein